MNHNNIALPGRVSEFIVNNLHRSMPVAVICREFHTNKNKLQESFREHLGTSLHAFMLQGRMEKGAKLLRTTGETVKFIARECGYKKVRSFNKAFKNHFGLSPDLYRKNMRDAESDTIAAKSYTFRFGAGRHVTVN